MNYRVLSHKHQDTGGHCTVSVFQIFDEDEKRTLFVLLNEESASIATADYISTTLDYDDVLILETVIFGSLQKTADNFELYRYCLNEYIKADCKYLKVMTYVQHHLLSDELQQQISAEYLEWHLEERGDLFETNGTEVTYHSAFLHSIEYCKQLSSNDAYVLQIKNFVKYLNRLIPKDANCTEEQRDAYVEELCGMPWTISIGKHSAVIHNELHLHTGMTELLEDFINTCL